MILDQELISYTHSTNSMGFHTNDGTKGLVINSDGHVVPAADSTYDLGLTGTRWRNLYADTLYGDGSNLTGIDADKIQEGNSYAEILDTGSNGIFRFLPENSEVFRIATNGHVGINTNNPGQDLTIYADGPNFRMTHTGNTNQKNSAYISLDSTGMTLNSYQEGTGTRRPIILQTIHR